MAARNTSRVPVTFESLESRLMLSAAPAAAHHSHPQAHPRAARNAVRALITHQKTTKGDPIFMQFQGITGEVTAKNFTGDIQINSFQWGVSRAINGLGTGRVLGMPSLSEIVITKLLDKASPTLVNDLLTGVSTPEVDIFFVNNGRASQTTYAEYKLQNVLISSYSASSSGDRPTESLSLNFSKITFTEIPLTSTGAPGIPVSTTFDLTSLG